MTTLERELLAQCENVVTVFQAEQVPCYALPDRPQAPDT
jgi:hypothetical protein